MSAPHLQHLAQLIANEGHAATFQSLGQYRTALLKEIAQASAAPEQEAVYEVRAVLGGLTGLCWESVKQLDLPMPSRHGETIKLYTHADPSDVTQLRADLETLERKCAGFSVLELFRNGLRDQLKAATQRVDVAERKLAEAQALLNVVKDWVLDREISGVDAIYLIKQIDAFLSATAQPAESEIHYPGDGVKACKECPDRAELREACKRFVAGNKPAEVKS